MRKLALALLLSLTACGAATSPTGSDTTGATASTPAASAAAAPSEAAQASTLPAPVESGTSVGTIGGNMGGADDVEQLALQALETQFKINTASLKLQNKEEVEWSDGSLGCAAPDMMYAQVITPGYKLTYSDGSQSYELHTNQSGSQVIWCENGKPRTTP